MEDQEEVTQLGCSHYQRKCQLKSPCCNEFYWCRFCHNDKVQAELLQYSLKKTIVPKCKVEEMDRHSVTTVKCMKCMNEQVITEDNFNKCTSCGVEFGHYACFKCKFYNDDPDAQIYHCDGCGMCRRGVKEDFVHCTTCAACMPHKHKCVANNLHHNCAVCMEFLFTSTRNAISLPNCGHSIHSACYKQLVKSGAVSCPLCSMSIYNKEDLEDYYGEIDEAISTTPMPDELKDKKSDILCNDCLAKSNVPFHFYGLKCQQCGSYNTKQIVL